MEPMDADPSVVLGPLTFDFLVLGGGVGGVTCCEELVSLCKQNSESLSWKPTICLISASKLLKGVGTLVKLSQNLCEVDVAEYSADAFSSKWHTDSCSLTVIQALATDINPSENTVSIHRIIEGSVSKSIERVEFKELLVATGGRPRMFRLSDGRSHARIVALRDSESIDDFRRKLSDEKCRRILVVGNGGISLELVYALWKETCEDSGSSKQIVWCVKHAHIGNTFLDSMAAAVLIPELYPDKDPFTGLSAAERGVSELTPIRSEMVAATTSAAGVSKKSYGVATDSGQALSSAAVGPRWVAQVSHVPFMVKPLWMQSCVIHNEDESEEKKQSTVSTVDKSAVAVERDEDTVDVEGIDSVLKSETHKVTDATLFADCSDLSSHSSKIKNEVILRLKTQISAITECVDSSEALEVTLTNGETMVVDLLVCALGVKPVTGFCDERVFAKTSGGCLRVDEYLQCVGHSHVFAAGDCCHIASDSVGAAVSWLQMQLWSQAQNMGWVSAHSMFASRKATPFEDDIHLCFNWELFAHCTRFFGRKCVFLGRFNAQKLEDNELVEYKTRARLQKDRSELVKLVVECSRVTGAQRVVGAVLIGHTQMEETCENLILNRTDIAQFGDSFLDWDVDLEDMFD